MLKKWALSYNPYFVIPFLIWVVTGGIALWAYEKNVLFLAVNSHYSEVGDIFMYYVTIFGQAEVIAPVLLLTMCIPKYRNKWYFFTALACNAVPFFIQHFIKDWLNLPRPRLVFRDVPNVVIHYQPNWEVLLHTSFPSGHSQGAFTFFCLLSLLLGPRHRHWGLLFFVLAMAVGYSRIYLTAHFFSDVYAGSIIGTLGTLIVFSIMDHFMPYFFKQKSTA